MAFQKKLCVPGAAAACLFRVMGFFPVSFPLPSLLRNFSLFGHEQGIVEQPVFSTVSE